MKYTLYGLGRIGPPFKMTLRLVVREDAES